LGAGCRRCVSVCINVCARNFSHHPPKTIWMEEHFHPAQIFFNKFPDKHTGDKPAICLIKIFVLNRISCYPPEKNLFSCHPKGSVRLHQEMCPFCFAGCVGPGKAHVNGLSADQHPFFHVSEVYPLPFCANTHTHIHTQIRTVVEVRKIKV
jgi:hypothetical protein